MEFSCNVLRKVQLTVKLILNHSMIYKGISISITQPLISPLMLTNYSLQGNIQEHLVYNVLFKEMKM